MNAKLVLGISAVVVALGASGCSKDAEIDEFIQFNSALASEVAQKGEKEGPDAAQKAFDDKKGDLKVRFDKIKDARGFQVSEQKSKALESSVTDSVMKVCGGQITLDKAKSQKFKKLCDDYTETLQ